jgi:adenylate cyclase
VAAVTPATCPDCAETVPDRAKFCSACGTALRVEPAERERKQVTAMFVDIVGSMDLAEQLSDERWRDVLDEFFAAAAASVHAVEGTVHQFTGDGIMALFGAPVACEDHASRGCLAALDLHRRVTALAPSLADADLQIRIGLHSGEVIVGLLGDAVQMDWAAVGHTTGIAKRMESLAPAGSTAMSAATATLVAGQFTIAELGTMPVKGVREPQRVIELNGLTEGVRGRVDAASRGGTLSDLVGRHEEQALLAGLLQDMLRGAGRAVALVGEPGVGKSRLLHEFVSVCASAGTTTHRLMAEPHGRSTPLRPVLALLREVFGIVAGDDDVMARERVARKVEQVDADDDDLLHVLDLLGLADPSRPAPSLESEGRQRRLQSFVGRLVRSGSERNPVVLVCEDLHWYDDASLGFLAELVRSAENARVLVVATMRPEHDPTQISGSHTRHVALFPLSTTAVQELLSSLLGTDRSLDGLAELVAERAGGNPFFCEELVTALRETGHLAGRPGHHVLVRDINDLILPTTVQATITSRIDQLAPRAKRLLYDAAVIGLEFETDLVAGLAQESPTVIADDLDALVAAEMVVEHGRNRYAFRHPLIREVAHHTQLASRRQQAHNRLAQALVQLHPDGLDEQAALLAHHCAAAQLPLQAASWHARAAHWAERTSSSMGMDHWQAVRRLTDEAPRSPECTRLAVEARIGILNQSWRVGADLEDSRQVHREGLALLTPDHDAPVLQLGLDWGLYTALIFTGYEREGYLIGVRNMALAESIGDPAVVLTTAAGSAYGAVLVGRIEEAIAIADRGLSASGGDVTMGAGVLMANPYAHSLVIRAMCTCLSGDVGTATTDLERALSIAETHDAPEMVTYAHCGLALVHTGAKQPGKALEHATASMELAENGGNAWGQTMASQAVAWARLGVGDLDGAERSARHGMGLIASSGIGSHYEPLLRTTLAIVMMFDGRLREAREDVTTATAIAQDRGLRWAELPARLAEAHVHLATGDSRSAVVSLDRGAALAAQTGIRLYDAALASARRRANATLATQP